MVDRAIGWAVTHPLQAVAALAIVAVLVGLFLTPRFHELGSRHTHPRC